MNELKIKKILREFSKKRDWDQFHSLKNLAISINLESSELLEIFQWEKESSEFYKKKENLSKIKEEVADIMLYLLRFSDIAGIDLEKECLKKIEINKKRYPIKNGLRKKNDQPICGQTRKRRSVILWAFFLWI